MIIFISDGTRARAPTQTGRRFSARYRHPLTCRPLTTSFGTTALTTSIAFVTASAIIIPPTSTPDADTSSLFMFWARATAAMLFMGWTGMGTSHARPARKLDRPAKNRAGGKEMASMRARAIVNGMKVPRSPKEPLISDNVRRLGKEIRRGKHTRGDDTIGMEFHTPKNHT